jgi:hypothetical protein
VTNPKRTEGARLLYDFEVVREHSLVNETLEVFGDIMAAGWG